jgi:DNA-directed RNA polymerase subunit L
MSSIIEPIVSNVSDEETNTLRFTLSDVDVSIANAIRRVILSDVNVVVFRTTPNEENQANFVSNTTRLNNEILKQRLSCIPIYIKSDIDFANLLLEVNEENTTDTMYMVTTQHFKIKNTVTNTYLSDAEVLQIFPPFTGNNGKLYHTYFVRLRPRISDEIPGEKIHFTCKFSIGNAKENSMFNVVGTCGYGFTQDDAAAQVALAKMQTKWSSENADVEFESKNWNLLEAKRYTIKNSFEFEIKTACVFENKEIIYIACQEIINKLSMLIMQINTGDISTSATTTSVQDTIDYILSNEDYTIGNMLNYLLYKNYYEGERSITYCGFKKMHPHDTDSIIRMTFREYEENLEGIGFQYMVRCCTEAIVVFQKIMNKFKREEDTVLHFNNQEQVMSSPPAIVVPSAVQTPPVAKLAKPPVATPPALSSSSSPSIDYSKNDYSGTDSPPYAPSPPYGNSPVSPPYAPSQNNSPSSPLNANK